MVKMEHTKINSISRKVIVVTRRIGRVLKRRMVPVMQAQNPKVIEAQRIPILS